MFWNVFWNIIWSSNTFLKHVGPKHVQKHVQKQGPHFENRLEQKLWQWIEQ